MDKSEIIDLMNVYRKFSIDKLSKRYYIPYGELQAVIDELSNKGLLVKESDDKWKYIEKSKTFHAILAMLHDIYDDTDISEADMEFLAWDLEYEIESGDINCIPNAVSNFWAELLWCREHSAEMDDIMFDDSIDFDDILSAEVDSSLSKDWDIFEQIIDILEVNDKNAHTLCQSFLDYNDYNLFVRLVTDFRELLSEDELKKVFEAAECFDSFLVDCYK